MTDNDAAMVKSIYINIITGSVLACYITAYNLGNNPNPEVIAMWFAALLIWKIPGK